MIYRADKEDDEISTQIKNFYMAGYENRRRII